MSFENFSPIWSHVDEKKITKNEIIKIKIGIEKGLEIWTDTIPPNAVTVVTLLPVSVKKGFTAFNERTDEGCLRDDSSSTMQHFGLPEPYDDRLYSGIIGSGWLSGTVF